MKEFKIVLLMIYDWFLFTHAIGVIIVLINIVSKDYYVFNYWIALMATTFIFMVTETLSNGWNRNKKFYEDNKDKL